MSHDATKVLMGTTRSSFKVVESHAGAIAAGKVVHLKSDGTITTAIADGAAIGVSLGLSQSDIDVCPVVKKGTGVPVLLTADATPVIGAQVNIDDTTGMADDAGSGVTAVNAIYASGALTGIAEDGSEVDCVLIDFPGGL
jgi:hypothetical protein